SADEQIARLTPALSLLAGRDAVVSVDTTSPEVARFALARGATVVNDVSCLRDDSVARAVAETDAWLVLSHSRAPMAEMDGFSAWPDDDYGDIVTDVMEDWAKAKARALSCGVKSERLLFDPGLGF